MRKLKKWHLAVQICVKKDSQSSMSDFINPDDHLLAHLHRISAADGKKSAFHFLYMHKTSKQTNHESKWWNILCVCVLVWLQTQRRISHGISHECIYAFSRRSHQGSHVMIRFHTGRKQIINLLNWTHISLKTELVSIRSPSSAIWGIIKMLLLHRLAEETMKKQLVLFATSLNLRKKQRGGKYPLKRDWKGRKSVRASLNPTWKWDTIRFMFNMIHSF